MHGLLLLMPAIWHYRTLLDFENRISSWERNQNTQSDCLGVVCSTATPAYDPCALYCIPDNTVSCLGPETTWTGLLYSWKLLLDGSPYLFLF